VLVSYRLPLLKHCFVLCSDAMDGVDASGQIAHAESLG
jgi:hypothetical protein